MLLVGLPVLLISAALTAAATDDVNPIESLPRNMGQAQARVSLLDLGPAGHRVQQGPFPMDGDVSVGGGAAVREPGVGKHEPWTPKRVQRLTGGTVLATTTVAGRAEVDDRHIDVEGLLLDARHPASRGMASLTSGRWPRTSDEVVVTSAGAAAGLPTSGTLTIRGEGEPVTVTVVGTGTAWATYSDQADFLALPSASTAWQLLPDRPRSFLVARPQPVTWSDVKRLNTYGLVVESRAVFEHPQEAEAEAARQFMGDNREAEEVGIVALLVVGILLETMLLAGPAFAVSAARQRRSLALIASNGARRSQIRRYVLAQAVLLGVFAAVGGAVLGAGAGLWGLHWWASTHPGNAPGPVDIPFWELLGVVACASLASLVAAYLPARGASRLDLVGVLRGQGITARPVHRGLPVVGVVLAGIGGVVLAMNVANHGQEAGIAIGAVVLVVGSLMLVPWLLARAGQLGRGLPLPLRMATRDVGRQRGRSAPAVAAIMVAVTSLTALAIANTSDQTQAARDYQPQTTMGEGLVYGSGARWPAESVAVVHEQAPGLTVQRIRRVGVSDRADPESTESTKDGPQPTTVVRLQKASCAESPPTARGKALVVPGYGPVGRCSALGSDRYEQRTSIGVVDLADARDILDLNPAQLDVLARGGVLVAKSHRAVHDGRATVLTGTRRATPYGEVVGKLRDPRVAHLPAGTVDTATLDRFGLVGDTGALVTPATAKAQHWPTFTDALQLRDPGGTISSDAERAIMQHLPEDAFLSVERGYQSDLVLLYTLLFGVFGTLVLVATLISTALAQAEGRADLGTLAAVGATKRLRRAVAGSQAFVVALAGSVLGLVVGFVPGVALTWPLTAGVDVYDGPSGSTPAGWQPPGPVIDIPWLVLAAVVIGVPVLAALLAAAAIRKSPEVTRRAT